MGSQFSTLSSQLRGARRRGFALLLTLTLLAFVVLLLVGLGTYTRVETAIAGNTQRQAQARENALLALNVAVAQLQRQAGPDTRVTATAQTAAGADAQKRRYTGVWDTAAGTGPVWLASGVETPAGVDIAAALPAASRVALVGTATDGSTAANATSAALIDITVPGVPGQPAAARPTIGRYAWWVGDQGVKAPVAVADDTAAITYAPYDSAELRSRLRQQLPLGAGAADATGSPVFEPRDANNRPLIAGDKIVATNQLALLRNATNATLNPALVRQNFHAWSPNNLAVLANTKLGGLRQDLSLRPDLLGAAFAAWANYSAYMEPPVAATPPSGEGSELPSASTTAMLPDYGAEPIRRRHVLTPHLVADGGSHQVAPVLTYFLITFNVRTGAGQGSLRPLEVRARWIASLWNPYTSALVPEDLRLEITGLPQQVRVVNDDPESAGTVGDFSLADAYGDPLRVQLPWASATIPDDVPADDRHSWLPGRVYSWRSAEDESRSVSPPPEGYASDFYSLALGGAGAGAIRPLSLPLVNRLHECHLEVAGSETLRLTLYVMRAEGPVRLAAFVSPEFLADFSTNPQRAEQSGYQFSYIFRLAEGVDTPAAPATWLATDGRDVRRRTLPSEAFVVGANGNDPAQYNDSNPAILSSDRLFSRGSTALSYEEDVPVFELPRAPLLTLGALQHFRLIGQRPFMIGNPWVGEFALNGIRVAETFDRFFFSGLADGTVPGTDAAGNLVLPNALLRPLRQADGSRPTADAVRATAVDGDPAAARSAKFFLQEAAFNLNSVNATAWAAVLRGVRFPAPESFGYLDKSDTTGTADDLTVATVQSDDAQFFRFPQSAQETYKEPETSTDESIARTFNYRRGMRSLDGAQVAALAAQIVQKISARHATAGAYRSLEEFLAPDALHGTADADGNPTSGPRSVLEAAIADAALNDGIEPLSSRWLTQADIMTALAPVLFPRSDTFVVRTYGEAVNPVTGAIEGRAWAEATVQRVPEYFDPSQPPETLPADLNALNALHGRRFKVVSFRWLTRSDI